MATPKVASINGGGGSTSKDITAEQLMKWLAIALLTAGIVIILMKGMLALAVYLIKTLPISMVS